MPTIPGFRPHQDGVKVRLTRRQMVASEAKSIGDALTYQGSASTLKLAASNDDVVTIYWDADRTSTPSDTPFKTVALVLPGTMWEAEVEAGTAASTQVDDEVDLNSADGIDVGTTTNGDFHITKFISTTRVVGFFNVTPYTGKD